MAAPDPDDLRRVLLAIGTTASFATDFISEWGSSFDDLLTHAKDNSFISIRDICQLDSDMVQEVFLLIAWMHLNSVTDFVQLNTNVYTNNRRGTSLVSADLLQWYDETPVPTRPTRRDVVPANTTFVLNWRLSIHDRPSLVANIDEIQSIQSDSISRLQLSELTFCATGLKDHGDEYGMDNLSTHSPRSTITNNTKDFFRRLGWTNEEIQLVEKEMISLDYLNLVKYREDFRLVFVKVRQTQRDLVCAAIQTMVNQTDTTYSRRIQQYHPPHEI